MTSLVVLWRKPCFRRVLCAVWLFSKILQYFGRSVRKDSATRKNVIADLSPNNEISLFNHLT